MPEIGASEVGAISKPNTGKLVLEAPVSLPDQTAEQKPDKYSDLREEAQYYKDVTQHLESKRRGIDYRGLVLEQLKDPKALDVPDRFKYHNLPDFLKTEGGINNLTELGVLNGELRIRFALILAKAIIDGKEITVTNIDVDQLKRLNDAGHRDLGDCGILRSTASILQEVDKAELSKECDVFAFKSGTASDELCVITIGANNEDVKKLSNLTLEINQKSESVTVPNSRGDNGHFVFASSVGFVHTGEGQWQEYAQREREWLLKNQQETGHLRPAFFFLNDFLDIADVQAHEVKLRKQEGELPVRPEDRQNMGMLDYLQLIVDKYGGQRISKDVLTALISSYSLKSGATLTVEEQSELKTKLPPEIYQRIFG